jgi:hypothetical protein
VLKDGGVITSGLGKVIWHELHKSNLQSKLEKDNDWQDKQYDNIDWEAYMQKHRRAHRISITKLSHQLQNNVMSCPSDKATSVCEQTLHAISQSLQKYTPPILWKTLQSTVHQRAPPNKVPNPAAIVKSPAHYQ